MTDRMGVQGKREAPGTTPRLVVGAAGKKEPQLLEVGQAVCGGARWAALGAG